MSCDPSSTYGGGGGSAGALDGSACLDLRFGGFTFTLAPSGTWALGCEPTLSLIVGRDVEEDATGVGARTSSRGEGTGLAGRLVGRLTGRRMLSVILRGSDERTRCGGLDGSTGAG